LLIPTPLSSSTIQSQASGVTFGGLPDTARPETGLLGLAAAMVCSLAIGSVPVFSASQDLSFIPQGFAALGVGLALLTALKRIPSPHVAMLAYGALVLFWGITLLSEPELWSDYQTLLKVGLLALACHVVFRSPTGLLLLFGTYCATGAITLLLNWHQLQALSASMTVLAEKDRFAGTFENANTAGMYGVMLMLSAVIVCFNSRAWWRWPLGALGLVSGLAMCFFSGSRKAMLGLGILILLFPWMSSAGREPARVGRGGRQVRIAAMVLVSLVTGLLLFSKLPFIERLVAPFTEGVSAESSSDMRYGMLVKTFELWTAHPLFGCGFEGFSRLSEFGVYSHTTFGEVLCNGGLFGIGLLAVFYVVPALQLPRLMRQSASGEHPRLGAALFAFWAIFTLLSFFAVLFDSREFVPIYAGICGYLQENRVR
jgi:hypothetical protein